MILLGHDLPRSLSCLFRVRLGVADRSPRRHGIVLRLVQVYTMQKTCDCGGREFYGLGRYSRSTHQFTLLDATSDLGNNVFDGGEGYAHMNVLDPRATAADPHGRMLWTGAVIEGDRNPESCAGFPLKWNTRGWFGTLTLPRVIRVGNITHDSGMSDVFLRTPPLPELALLRETRGVGASTTVDASPTPIPTPLSPSFRAQSFEVSANFTLPPASADGAGWDLGLQLLWNNHVDEFTRVGVRDGEFGVCTHAVANSKPILPLFCCPNPLAPMRARGGATSLRDRPPLRLLTWHPAWCLINHAGR